MKKSSQDMCTRRAMDFAPTPSTLLLLLLSNLPRMKSSSRGLPTYHECTVVHPGVYLLTTNEQFIQGFTLLPTSHLSHTNTNAQ